jgi:hypothetical protein
LINGEKEQNMPIHKTVRRGDSLWRLAGRYLGNGARFPQIRDFHNREAARHGLRHIGNPNLIFVGETILIPPRPKFPKPGNGTQAAGDHMSIPINLKATYTIGRDTPPVIYAATSGDYSIKTEMSGEIGIENKTPGHLKYVHNYELAMSKNSLQAKQKICAANAPALAALTAKPEMVFESGQVKIKAPIAANANLGPYSVRVNAENPLHMSGTLKPPTVSGTLELGGNRYKYSADIKFKVDVFWHQRPKGGPKPVKDAVPVKPAPLKEQTQSSRWNQTVSEEGVVVAVVALVLYAAYRATELFATKGVLRPTTIPPFIYKNDHSYPPKEA